MTKNLRVTITVAFSEAKGQNLYTIREWSSPLFEQHRIIIRLQNNVYGVISRISLVNYPKFKSECFYESKQKS